MWFRTGSAAAPIAPIVAAAIAEGLPRVEALSPEPRPAPQVVLADPFPDPGRPGSVVTRGSLIDPDAGEVWMVVTSETPPEPIGLPLASLYAAHATAAGLGPVVEGFGLYLSGIPDSAAVLRGKPLPAWDEAPDDTRLAMALSFVHFLVARDGEEAVAARIAAADLTLREADGDWRDSLATGGASPTSPRSFIGLAWRQSRPYRLRQIEVFVLMLFALAFAIVFPFVFRQLIDVSLPAEDEGAVAAQLALLGGAFVVSLAASLRRAYLSGWISGAIIRDIRTELFDHLQRLELGWFRRHHSGDVTSRIISDVAVVEQGLSSSIREGAFAFVQLTVSLVVIFMLDPILSLVVVAGIPLVAIIYRTMSGGARSRSMEVQERVGHLVSVTGENYEAQPVVKAFNLEERESRRFHEAAQGLFRSEVRLGLFTGFFGVSVELVVTLLRIAVLALGAALIFGGDLTIGGLVAFVMVMGNALGPVTDLTQVGQTIQSSTGALQRVSEVLDSVPQVASKPGAQALPRLSGAIEALDVTLAHEPGRPVLDRVSVRVEAGTRVAFVGPSGAGKSTLLSVLLRVVDPDDGAVLIDGVDLRDATVESLRAQTGVVFQDTFLFDGTLRENIEVAHPSASGEEIATAVAVAGLDSWLATLPAGLDTPVGERGSRLSGGQRQRVAIARAVVRDPALLVLDEATSALDPKTERQVSDALQRASEGRTTIAVTHRLSSVTDYDEIYVLVAGRVAEHGRHDELLARDGAYAELWREQTEGRGSGIVDVDAAVALARLPLFAEMPSAQLGAVAAALERVEVPAGWSASEQELGLAIVSAGALTVVDRGLNGGSVDGQKLGPGDAFGIEALLGSPSGALVRADEDGRLLVLRPERIEALAADMPDMAEALGGRNAMAPASGRRLRSASGILPALTLEQTQ